MLLRFYVILCLIVLLAFETNAKQQQGKNSLWKNTPRSFTIDYENDVFLKDGFPFRYVSGSIHYFRVHPSDWADRLRKMKYAGLNVVQVYVEWASHEPEPGQFDFTGALDLPEFLAEAQRQDLLVNLRAGPYMCAERDMGGLPYWLMRLHPNVRLRTSDPNYMTRVMSWLLLGLFPRIKPLLYHNGGPVIMVQVENEYGNYYACDYSYTCELRRIFRAGLGPEILLFTTDNGTPSSLRCGKSPLVYATVDFGVAANAVSEFGSQRLFEPEGPLVNSEFYSGWLDHWGRPRQRVNTSDFVKALDSILALKASVNIYMFHGGTNFGFTAGADTNGGHYSSCLTTYDYDAPLSEAGDMTNKYEAVRRVIGKYLPLPGGPTPSNSSKAWYGPVLLEHTGLHSDLHSAGLLESIVAPFPLTFEELSVFSGIVIYSTVVNFTTPDPSILNLGAVHDRGYVVINGARQAVVSRSLSSSSLAVRVRQGDTILVIVESLGRINVGAGINDFKGLTSNVTLNSKLLCGWTMTPLPLTDYERLTSALAKLKMHTVMKAKTRRSESIAARSDVAVGFFEGTLYVPEDVWEPRDTFLRFDGWTKGIAWVNGFCLGRYWPVMGPQNTLYVPHGVLKRGPNTVLLLELEDARRCRRTPPRRHSHNSNHRADFGRSTSSWYGNGREDFFLGDCSVEFVDTPDIDSPVPQ
ncbi:beta-galactosidase [Hyalella azteca]|uniref:Beta-galactosidase n=1 Tax=Hyalella azteca TaxID=294128 RepID=A0A8B7N3V3_HYAAZ|nr:beta-galactosidase [Hyalella azteca]